MGFASEFPIRQLEKAGQLCAVRGAMGQAWYPREAVLELLSPSRAASPGTADHQPAPRGPRFAGPWSDAELIGLLRELVPPIPLSGAQDGGTARPRTVVDLVADAGIPIARATRIHRFWLANDRHPTAELARAQAGLPSLPARPATAPAGHGAEAHPVAVAAPGPAVPSGAPAGAPRWAAERRGSDRVERERLIRSLRDPDPAVRARAFERLRPRQQS